MTYDFTFKSNAIETSMNELLDARAQIDALILPSKNINCNLIAMDSVKKHCEALQACPTTNQEALLGIQTEQITNALNQIQNIKKSSTQAKEKISGLPKGRKKEIERLEEEAILQIVNVNPLLMGDAFKEMVSNTHSLDNSKIKVAVVNQLKINRDEINKKLPPFNRAYRCLMGSNTNCEDFDKTMKEAKYKQESQDFAKQPLLSSLATLHNCVNRVSEARDESNSVIDEALVGAALGLTPMVAVNAVKLAATGARLAASASNIARVEGTINQANIAATLGFGGYQTKDVYDQCTQSNNEFEKLGAHQKTMSCQNLENILVHKSNTANCAGEVIVSAALLAPVAAPAVFKLASLAKKSKPALPVLTKEDVDLIHSTKDLTKRELKDNKKFTDVFGSYTNEERMAAVQVIKPDANKAQLEAVVAAHKIGEEAKQSYGTYTPEELRKKWDILSKAGFSDTEINRIMRMGIAGTQDAAKFTKEEAIAYRKATGVPVEEATYADPRSFIADADKQLPQSYANNQLAIRKMREATLKKFTQPQHAAEVISEFLKAPTEKISKQYYVHVFKNLNRQERVFIIPELLNLKGLSIAQLEDLSKTISVMEKIKDLKPEEIATQLSKSFGKVEIDRLIASGVLGY
jgi:hypothetical protein